MERLQLRAQPSHAELRAVEGRQKRLGKPDVLEADDGDARREEDALPAHG